MRNEVRGRDEPIFSYLTKVFNCWRSEFFRALSRNLEDKASVASDRIWGFSGSWAQFEELINEVLAELYRSAREGTEPGEKRAAAERAVLELYRRTAEFFKGRLRIREPEGRG